MNALRLLIVAACVVASGLAQADMKVVSEGKAIQVRADELIVRSARVGREFLIEVTPVDQVKSGRRYAAVYALDGGFGIAGPAARMLTAGQRTEPFFVIAIGYPNAMGRYLGPRNTDLAHRRVKYNGREFGGGGAAFEAFILEELRPYLESRYPLDPKKAVLLGHSGGGLFAATVLVTKPDAFSGYVIGGLPVVYESPLPQQAKTIAPRGNGQRVFIGLAPMDALNSGSDQFGGPLSGPESKFKVRQEIFADETHNSEYLQLLARGLPFVLPTETAEMIATKVTPEVLDRYAGTYRIDAQQTLKITRRGTNLVAELLSDELPRLVPLEADSETRFFSRAMNAIVTFERLSNGKSPRLVIRRGGVETMAPRIE